MKGNKTLERKHSPIYGIKGKLVSALCMLLVAVTMVVSSTYAWFTLSTAPEVSGIQTAVGSNGALEIWLNATDTTDENYTHGNIVDLSAGYGLDQVILLPGAIKYTDENKTHIDPRFLQLPDYAANGKPGNVGGKLTEAGILGDGDKFFANGSATGVRAVGVASGLTDRQLAYRNAKYAAQTNASLATSTAATSLNTNGAILGNVVIKKATVENATYTPEEVAAFGAIIADLKEATGYIETAYKEMIVALAASALVTGDGSDAVYSTVRANLAGGTLTLAQIVNDKAITIGEHSVSLDGTTILSAITALQTTVGNIAAAEQALTDLEEKASYTWEEISPIINKLIVMSAATLNGEDISADIDVSDLASSIMSNGINIGLNDGAGVYVEIAAHCGNYQATVEMRNVTAAGMTFEKLTANMATNSTQDPKHLTGALHQVEAAGTPAGANSGEMPMTEFYGFIIDLGFKTNAANSNLLLQTDPRDRIYEDNANEATQGQGSYMTYQATTTELTADQVKGLMDCIRIVFFDPSDREILGEARLDTAHAEIGADGVTAKMYMYKDNTLQDGSTGDNGVNDDTAIIALGQNDEVKVSVLVYLDGETIENADVAATDIASVTGSMNLQFASDADLVPMEYGDLHTPATPSN